MWWWWYVVVLAVVVVRGDRCVAVVVVVFGVLFAFDIGKTAVYSKKSVAACVKASVLLMP